MRTWVPLMTPAQSGQTRWNVQVGSSALGVQLRVHAPHASRTAPESGTLSQPAQLEPLPAHTPHASGV